MFTSYHIIIHQHSTVVQFLKFIYYHSDTVRIISVNKEGTKGEGVNKSESYRTILLTSEFHTCLCKK